MENRIILIWEHHAIVNNMDGDLPDLAMKQYHPVVTPINSSA